MAISGATWAMIAAAVASAVAQASKNQVSGAGAAGQDSIGGSNMPNPMGYSEFPDSESEMTAQAVPGMTPGNTEIEGVEAGTLVQPTDSISRALGADANKVLTPNVLSPGAGNQPMGAQSSGPSAGQQAMPTGFSEMSLSTADTVMSGNMMPPAETGSDAMSQRYADAGIDDPAAGGDYDASVETPYDGQGMMGEGPGGMQSAGDFPQMEGIGDGVGEHMGEYGGTYASIAKTIISALSGGTSGAGSGGSKSIATPQQMMAPNVEQSQAPAPQQQQPAGQPAFMGNMANAYLQDMMEKYRNKYRY